MDRKCPICSGEFEEGIIADAYSKTGAIKSQRWGTKKLFLGLMGLQNSKEVKTNCCKNCGYLESYAK